MDQINYMIGGKASSDPSEVGGKAATLSQLSALFPIPDWIVVPTYAFVQIKQGNNQSTAAFENEIKEAIQVLDPEETAQFAVRSSAIAEDGEKASFAGQFSSYLNVNKDQVIEKVYCVLESGNSQNVSEYKKNIHHLEGEGTAVIIQKMVHAEMAGVAFSVDPITGDPETCIINATKGLADQLVSGEVNGDTYYTDRSGRIQKQTLCSQNRILNDALISQIVDLTIRVENHFGKPQDIEWAIEKGKLYLVQARPITNLKAHHLTGVEKTIWDNSNIVESYSGVTSPLTFSFARYVYEHVYRSFCKVMNVSQEKINRESQRFATLLGYINGHVYYNLINWYYILALFPGFKINRHFMEEMMGVSEPLPDDAVAKIITREPSFMERVKDGFSLFRTLFGLIFHQINLSKTINRFYKRLNESLSSPKSLQTLSLDLLAQEYRTLENNLLSHWDAPLINDFLCMIAFGISRKLLKKFKGDEGLRFHNDFMIGQGDIISAEPVMRIREMAQMARGNDEVVKRLIEGDQSTISKIPELESLYHEYLNKFGDRCLQELKLESPTLHDDPKTLLQAIGHMAMKSEKQLERSETKLSMNPIKNWLVLRSVHWAKRLVRNRENLRFERTRVFGRVRKIFIEIGQRLFELNYLQDPRDIFFLEVSEIMGIIEGTATTNHIESMIRQRKDENLYFQSLKPPPNRIETRGSSIYAFSNQNFISKKQKHNSNSNTLQGIGCCQGVVTARVRVIDDPRKAKLEAGEIMVAQFTDPGWIMLFANAAGILVERGSLLSHSAIVAREMGIPAIVAIDGVTKHLKTGEVVQMDGATGLVQKVGNDEK